MKNVYFFLISNLIPGLFVASQTPKIFYISFKPTEIFEGNPVHEFPQDSITTSSKEKITIFPQINYPETAGDYTQSKFSIDRDKKYVLPYIKSALAINPDIKLFASPWSPPAWMKVSGKMVGIRPDNTLKDSAKIYKAYSLYLTKYIKAYAKEGVTISRLNPQNETDMNSTYPSCVMTTKEMSNLVMNYLIPEFKRSNVKTEIWAGT